MTTTEQIFKALFYAWYAVVIPTLALSLMNKALVLCVLYPLIPLVTVVLLTTAIGVAKLVEKTNEKGATLEVIW